MLDVKKIRKDFPILSRKIHGKPLVYLDSSATTQKPRQVISAMDRYYRRHNANVHRGVHTLSGEATEMVERARASVARFIGASSSDEVIFVRNATEGVNLIRYAWGEQNIGSGDSVVVTMMEHHSNFVPWQQLAKQKGAAFKIADVTDDGRLKIFDESGSMQQVDGAVVGTLEDLLDERVKVVGITHVSNVLGTINPLSDIIPLVRKKAPQALVVVDAAQSVPHMPVDIKRIGADFLVFSGHKMLGPTGIGVLWGRRELLDAMPPFLFGGDMISEVGLSDTVWNRLPWKFEAGTPNMAGMVGMEACCQYLRSVGMQLIRQHEQELVSYALTKLQVFEKEGFLTLYGVRDASVRGGVVTFNVVGVHAHDTAQVLDSEGIAVRSGHHCAMPLARRLGVVATVRASFYIYTLQEEIDRLADGLLKVRRVFKV